MRQLKSFVFLLCLLGLNMGCDLDIGTPDGNGTLGIYDETHSPGWFDSDSRIAVGATLHMRVSEPGITLKHVHSDNPKVVLIQQAQTIDALSEEDSPSTRLTLIALEEGTARVHVELEDGRTDFKTIIVTAAKSHSISLYPWWETMALDPALWAKGFKLLPNTNLTLFGSANALDGSRLSGFKSVSWRVNSTGDARVKTEPDSDYVVFKSGELIARTTVQFGDSDPLDLSTIAPSDVSRLEIINRYDSDDPLYVGDTLLMHVALFTEDGAYVSGIGDETVEYETSPGASATQPVLFARAYHVGRAVDFSASRPGVHTLTARWGDVEASIEIEVISRPESSAKPQH